MSIRPIASVAALIVLLSACGGGGSGGSSSDPTPPAPRPTSHVVVYYDAPAKTRKQAEGPAYTAADGTVVRHGAWVEYFADPANTKQWDRTYVDGAASSAGPWTEWNADGSIRYDASDR